jgi:lipopolysaccharide/colanic/teichoic acid biosynthesis glycosyltransferase
MTARRLPVAAICLVGIVAMVPLFLLLAAAILLLDGRPVLYRAERVGLGGRTFRLLKFRTMRPGCAGSAGSAVTGGADPRITPVGRVLRRTKLDELPQLLNVLRGDMALVGPRPEDPRFVALYSEAEREVLTVRPGITSPAAVRYRHEESLLAAAGDACEAVYVTEIMRPKLELDLEYVRRRSMRLDLAVLALTAAAMLARAPEPRDPAEGGGA